MAGTSTIASKDRLAALKQASRPEPMQEAVIGEILTDKADLERMFESLRDEAEEAGDSHEFAKAAQSYCIDMILAWTLNDNRMTESCATQALYYGAMGDMGTLVDAFVPTWAVWAHLVSCLDKRDRARLQDFARFRRSLEIAVRHREDKDERIAAAASLLAGAFDKLGEFNLKAAGGSMEKAPGAMDALWDEVAGLLDRIEGSGVD
jgi:hypothetical protein